MEKEPEDMIRSDNSRNYAYVTLMTDMKYFAGALVLAESINKLGSQTDIIIMITREINKEIEDLLKRYYTKVIIINKIDGVDVKFNKIQGLKLTEYKKILLIDIDAIILKYPDNLFTLEEPAGVRIPKDTSIFFDKNKEKEYKEWFKDNDGYENVYSGLLLLKPDNEKYKYFEEKIKKDEYSSFKDLANKLDKEYGRLSNISGKFVGICSYMDDWNNLYGLQFTGDKPFFYESNEKIEDRSKREDNKLWFYYYRMIIEKNSDLYFLENKELKEVNELSRYYLSNLGRNIIKINRLLKEKINTKVDDKYKTRLNKIFKTTKINKNYDYYHIEISREYEINVNYSNDELINTDINYEILKNKKKYELIDKYLITSGKVVIFFIIGDKEKGTKNNDYLENIIKEEIIILKKESLINFLMNVDTTYVYEERKKNLEKYYKLDEYYLRILTLEFNDEQEFKIRNKWNLKIFQNVNEKLKILSIINNKNSLNKVFNLEINFIERYENILENLKYQSLVKWIYNNYTGDQIDKIEIIKMNINEDIEYLVIDNNEYSNEISVRIIINKKLFFIDIIFSQSVFFKSKYKEHEKLIDENKKNIYKIDGLKFIELGGNK